MRTAGYHLAVEDQATDRVHRIGQDRTVYVHRVLVQGTLEERIVQLLRDKRGVADQIMSGARRAAQTWTREELLDLLRPLDLVARQPAAATPPR
jgi:SNF2 family DNA or RNA helicase